MSKKKKWTIWFLLIATPVAIVSEVWAAADGNPNTIPWTDYIVTYVPEELYYLLAGGLTIWFWQHFIRRYNARRARTKAKETGAAEGSERP